MNKFDPLNIKPGTKSFNYIKIVENLATGFDMPVGVVNGYSDGPTLIVTGGLYPTEYCGVEAASRLYQMIQPENLEGRFIVIPVVNMPVFQFRTPWFNLRSSISPMDGGNINKFFPGNIKGTVTAVLAHKLFKIIEKTDYHIDFRGGDLPESHLEHTIFLRIGKTIDSDSELLAQVFGLEYVLPGTPDIGHTSPGTLIYEAVKAGVPSIISEAGLGYRTQPLEKFIMAHVNGTKNILKHFGMIKGKITRPNNQRYLDMEWHPVNTQKAGIFEAIADQGETPSEGEVIGRIKDLDGSILEEITSPITGIVHSMFPRRVVYPGDRLYTLLEIGEPTGW